MRNLKSKMAQRHAKTMKLRFLKEKYVLRNDKTTICTLSAQIVFEGRPLSIVKTFYGVSNCNTNDIFDGITGRHIAQSRAKSYAYDWADKEAKNITKQLMNFTVRMTDDLKAENAHLRAYEKRYCDK